MRKREIKIYRCSICGNISLMIESSGVTPVCCSRDMRLLEAKTDDEFHEKHVPVIKKEDDKVTVTVGSVLHPMSGEHYIEWILLETSKGVHIEYLAPDTEPSANFILKKDEEIKAAYAYCNIHGLWKGTCC